MALLNVVWSKNGSFEKRIWRSAGKGKLGILEERCFSYPLSLERESARFDSHTNSC
jgi:hypothetical protein